MPDEGGADALAAAVAVGPVVKRVRAASGGGHAGHGGGDCSRLTEHHVDAEGEGSGWSVRSLDGAARVLRELVEPSAGGKSWGLRGWGDTGYNGNDVILTPHLDQMAKDVTTFLSWSAEPELEERHRTGVKVIIYLILLTTLVYLSMKKIWSRVDTEV